MNQLFLILFLLCAFTKIVAQEIIFDEKAAQSEIISKLFEGKWNVTSEECAWKPNISEKFQFGESYNGLLYTKIDTAFNYKTSYTTYFVLIASTYIKEEGGRYETCHACSPSLSIIKLAHNNEQKQLRLESFNKFVSKYGSYGLPSDVSLFYIGGDDYCIKVDDVYAGQGETEGYTTLYYEGNNILSFSSYGDNRGTDATEFDPYEYETSIFVDKEHKKLLLNKKGTDIIDSAETSKVVTVNETITYEFKNGIFEKLCH